MVHLNRHGEGTKDIALVAYLHEWGEYTLFLALCVVRGGSKHVPHS